MKKLTILFLSFVALVFVGLYSQPAFAAEGDVNLVVQVVSSTGTDTATFSGAYGSLTHVNFDTPGYVYHIYNGEVGTELTKQFINSKSTYVAMVLADEVSAVYIDTNGQVLTAQYGEDIDPLLVDEPTKPGLEFNQWLLLDTVEEHEVFVATYTAKADAVLVEVTDGTASPAEPTYNQIVTLTPATPATFKYWADADGQFVSANPNYAFTALVDVELTAVTEGEAPAGPSVYLSNVSGIREGYQSFVGYVEYTGLTLVEYGVLASDEAEVLTFETEGVTVVPSTSLSATNEFLRSFLAGEFVSFRAYAKFGNGTVVYSDNNFVPGAPAGGSTFVEQFSSTNATTSYATGQFTGVNNTAWTFDARNEGDYPISGGGLTVTAGDYVQVILPNGFTTFKFQYRKAFTGGSNRTVKVDVTVAGVTTTYDIPAFGSGSGEQTTTYTFTYAGISVLSEATIKIYSTSNQATIDNFEWTEPGTTISRLDQLYQVSFINGSNVTNKFVIKGSNATAPSLSVAGHSLVGWFSNQDFSGNEFDFDNEIVKHINLYAKWTANQYTATFVTNGGSSLSPITYTYGVGYEQPSNPTKVGYTFDGWFSNQDLTTPYNAWNGNRDYNHNIYAKWTINQYSINFISNGGSSVANITEDFMSIINQPSNPIKSGFIFDAWFYDEELLNEVSWPIDMPVDGLSLYAGWLEVQSEVTVDFNANGGNGDAPDAIIGEPGDSIQLPQNTFERDGYSFVGWNTKIDGSGVTYLEEELYELPSIDSTLFAKWQNNSPTYIHNLYYSVDLRTQSVITGNSYATASNNTKIFDTVKVDIFANSAAKPSGSAQGLSNTTDPLFFAVNNGTGTSTEKAWARFETTDNIDKLVFKIYVGNNFVSLNGKSVLQTWNGTVWVDFFDFTDVITSSLTEYEITITGINSNYFRLLFTGTGATSNGGQFVIRNVSLYNLVPEI